MRIWFYRGFLAAALFVLAGGAGWSQAGFVKYVEPREKAFTALVPQGWQTEGGIVRWGPNVAGAVNATEAKVDFTIKSDAAGTMMARWLPDIMFIDLRGQPIEGMFAPGSQCNGCVVLPRLGGVNYLVKVILPRAVPGAQNVKVLGSARIPEVEKGFDQLRAMLQISLPLTYEAQLVAVEYTEGGRQFRQIMFTVIEDYIKTGVGLWKSRSTVLFRAPVAQFDAAVNLFKTVQASVQINNQWLADEMRAAEERTGTVSGTFQRIRELDADILKNRQETNAAIMKQMQKILIKQN